MQFDLIAAVDSKWGLSAQEKLPWTGTAAGKEDMQWFRENTLSHTERNVLIFGRKTWDAMNNKPLRGRVNIIVSRSYSNNVDIDNIDENQVMIGYMNSFEAALDWYTWAASTYKIIGECIVCGGAEIYQQAIKSPYLRYIYLTIIDGDFECDKHFPHTFLGDYVVCRSSNTGNQFRKYDFTNHEEVAYLRLLSSLLSAPRKPNRTGIHTLSISHQHISIRLHEPGRGPILPLLTTKKVIWRSIYHELIWMLRGSTDIEYLTQHNVHIWDGNSTREFLDSRKLHHYKPGEVGPVYGYQWRTWGAAYVSAHNRIADEPPSNDKGSNSSNNTAPNTVIHTESDSIPRATLGAVDQLAAVIALIKSSPWDRRMIVSAWNPSQLDQMALPPCHYSFQFNVDPDATGAPTHLNCLVNMRSSDVFVGLPFNIASYALLTHIVAFITKLTPGKLTINMCDAHLYENAIEQARTQLRRVPRRFPALAFSKRILEFDSPTIDTFAYKTTLEDFIVVDYCPMAYIKVDMAV